MLPRNFSFNGTVEIDPQIPVLAVTHWVSLSEWHDLMNVLDLAMPGIDGIETLKRLRKIDPDLQIVLLTGHGSIEKAVEATKLGAIDFLQKPASLSDLLELIHEASEKRAELAEKRASERAADVISKRGW